VRPGARTSAKFGLDRGRSNTGNRRGNEIQRDAHVGIEQLINGKIRSAAIAIETFRLDEGALSDLIIIVAISAAIDADTHVRVRKQHVFESEFAIEIGGSHGHPNGGIGLEQAGIIIVEEPVSTQRALPLERRVVSALKQRTRHGIHLGHALVGRQVSEGEHGRRLAFNTHVN
jgi:hypothetical protein